MLPLLPVVVPEELVLDEDCGWEGCLATKCSVCPLSTSKHYQGSTVNLHEYDI